MHIQAHKLSTTHTFRVFFVLVTVYFRHYLKGYLCTFTVLLYLYCTYTSYTTIFNGELMYFLLQCIYLRATIANSDVKK